MSITTAGGLHVKSIWSKAGVGTTVHVQGTGKQANMLFDCGHLDETEFAAKHVFISHGHVDHIGSCIIHARGKALSGKPATYYVPPHCVEPLRDAQRAFEILDDKAIPMKIVPMQPFDVVEVSPFYKVFAFPTQHRVPSQGYAIVHCKRGALFPQYANCDQAEIIELRKQKVRVHGQEQRVELVYSGDSTLQGLLAVPELFSDYLRNMTFASPEGGLLSSGNNNSDGNASVLHSLDLDFLFTADILLLEMTYLDGAVDKAVQRGHVHLEEFVAHGHMFGNRQIILMHISTKYGCQEIIDKLGRALAAQCTCANNGLTTALECAHLSRRCAVALKSFGDTEQIRVEMCSACEGKMDNESSI